LQAVIDRLETIRKADGFATDAGLAVMVGDIAIGPDDADVAVAVVPGEVQPLAQRTVGKVAEVFPITIAALARVESWRDTADAWMRAEDVLGDIHEAIETED